MQVRLITSVPLNPPWDQGDRNLAYWLTQALEHIRFHVLTVRDLPDPPGANLAPRRLYRSRSPGLTEKMFIFAWLLSHRQDQHQVHLNHLIYRPGWLSSLLMRHLPEIKRRPTLHTVLATSQSQAQQRRLYFADRVAVASEYGRKMLQKAGLQNVVYIPPGIEVARWAQLAREKLHFKAGLGLSGHPVVLYPGHYSPGYGLDTLLAALPTLRARFPGITVLLACRPRSGKDASRRQAVQAWLENTGLQDAVRFYDLVADMAALIVASDVTVLPFATLRDKVDIPTTLLENMAAGNPAIATDIAPMNELVQTGAVLGIPPRHPTALAEAILGVMLDAPLRKRCIQLGQTLVRERFDIRQVAHQYDQLYQEMVK